jgi:hypothetical protein
MTGSNTSSAVGIFGPNILLWAGSGNSSFVRGTMLSGVNMTSTSSGATLGGVVVVSRGLIGGVVGGME